MLKGTIKSQLQLITIGPLLAVIVIVSIFFLTESMQTVDKNIANGADEVATQKAVDSKYSDVYSRILLLASLALLFGVIFSYLFGRRLTLAIADLVETANEIEQKKFEKRCRENGAGELLKFQKTFNSMAEVLEQNEQERHEEIDIALQALHQTIEELASKDRDLVEHRKETFELVRVKAISDERTRIMKDIHDGIGGQLMASLSLIEKEENSTIRKNIHAILSACLDDFRLIINSLNIHANTLSAILADYKFNLSTKVTNLDIEINWTMDDFADLVELTPQQALHLLRILQEAFTNILKHSGATTIDFHSYEQQGSAVIIIEDNGDFVLPKTASSGQGMMNMQSRAKELGADIDISRSKAGGCRIVLVLSLPTSA